jgi:hypothetical protein
MSISDEVIVKRFAEWFLTPKFERLDDEKTLTDFSEKYDISATTLRRWRMRPEFEAQCNRLAKRAQYGRIQSVKNAVYENAVGGDTQAAKLFKEWEANLPETLKFEGEAKITVSLKDMIKAAEDEQDK